MEIEYTAETTPVDFHASEAFFRGIMGPLGSGKSVACTEDLKFRALTQLPSPIDGVRRSRFAVVRNTFGELKSTTIKTWQDWIPQSVCPIVYDSPIRGRMYQRLGDGTMLDMEVLFMSMDKPADVGKVLSLELTGAWANEARELPKAVIDAISSRVGRYPPKKHGGPTWSGVIADTNPPDDDHWWYAFAEHDGWKTDAGMAQMDLEYLKLMLDKESYDIVSRSIKELKDLNMDWEFFRQPGGLTRLPDGTYTLNPKAENVENQPLGYGYWLRMLPGKTQEWIKVYILGQYGAVFDGRPVYAEFNEPVHVARKPLGVYTQLPLILGWDASGLHPAVIVAQMTLRGQLRILRCIEPHLGGCGMKQFCANYVTPVLKQAFPKNKKLINIGDPAGAKRSETDEVTIFDMMKKSGYPCTKAATNNLAPRLESVQSMLLRMLPGGIPAMIIDPSCKTLIKGFQGGYRFERIQLGGEERYKDEPAKNRFSHCIAGDELVSTTLGQIPISQVKVGMLANTPVGPRRVLKAWKARENAELMRMETSDGRSLRATSDHKIWADGHWIKLDALQYPAILDEIDNHQPEDWKWEDRPSVQFRRSTASHTTSRVRATTRRASLVSDALATCTGTCGNLITGACRMAASFITRMRIGQTTTSTIWNACRVSSIPACTPSPGSGETPRPSTETSRRPRPRQPSGTRPTPDLRKCTAPSARRVGTAPRRLNSSARTAAGDISLTNARSRGCFVLRRARGWLGRLRGWMMSEENAPFVAASSRSISTRSEKPALKVAAVFSQAERADVYDLTVEGAHCFYVNGILVSNCHDGLQYLCMHVAPDFKVEKAKARAVLPSRKAWGAFT